MVVVPPSVPGEIPVDSELDSVLLMFVKISNFVPLTELVELVELGSLKILVLVSL